MKKLLIVFGTRPEAIKMAPLILKLKEAKSIEARVCVTAQHKDMLYPILSFFNIEAHYDLSVMKPEQSLSYVTNAVLSGVSNVLEEYSPDLVLVHGDTTSAFAGCLASFYKSIPVAHVEAGLRSGDIFSPFPEEFNRRSISLMSSFHFAPTEQSRANLISEGIKESSVFVTGNTVIDTLILTSQAHSQFILPSSPFILMTVHRREHSDSDISAIFRAVRQFCIDNPSLYVIYPVHRSPRLLRLSSQILEDLPNVALTPPLSLTDFHHALRSCHFVLTDSGGVQEEAAYLGKPVLVVRNTTERPEGESFGNLKLIGNDEDKIYNAMSILLNNKAEYEKASKACLSFGDGHASERITDILQKI